MRELEMALMTAVLCAACGTVDHPPDSPDAGSDPPDAAVDAVPIGSIDVTTYSRCCTDPPHTLAAGITVYVIGPDGRLAATATTGAEGRATFDAVVTGSAVMAVYPAVDGRPITATTMLGVEPGDALVFGEDYGESIDTSTGGSFAIDVPPVAASSIYVWLPCSSASQSPPISPVMAWLPTGCQRPHATVPITAMDDNFHLLASAALHDIDLTIDTIYTIDAWTPPIMQVATAAVPAGVTTADFAVAWPYPGLMISDQRDASFTGGTATATFPGPVGADSTAVTARFFRPGLGEHDHGQVFAAAAPGLAVAVAELPWMGTPVVDVAAQSVHWSQEGSGGDAVYFELRYQRADDSADVDWTVIAPPGTSALSWASFPAEVPAPRDHDLAVQASAGVVDLGPASSYRELRTAPEWAIRCPLCLVERGELPAASVASAEGMNR